MTSTRGTEVAHCGECGRFVPMTTVRSEGLRLTMTGDNADADESHTAVCSHCCVGDVQRVPVVREW